VGLLPVARMKRSEIPGPARPRIPPSLHAGYDVPSRCGPDGAEPIREGSAICCADRPEGRRISRRMGPCR
jgi:hypothetical protein